MDNVRIQTAHHVGIDFEVAGLGDRVIAALIDYAILFCYLIAISLVTFQVESTALAVVLFLPAFLYFLLCEIFFEGQSIGKKVRGLKVAMLDGSQPTLASYLLRWLLRAVDVTLTMGMAGMVTILASGKGQRLGDLAAGTTVVRARPRVSLRDTIYAALDERYTPVFHQVEALTDDDIATAKDVLNTLVAETRTHTSFVLGTRMKAVLETKMHLASDLPPAEFLRTVIKDYNAVKGHL